MTTSLPAFILGIAFPMLHMEAKAEIVNIEQHKGATLEGFDKAASEKVNNLTNAPYIFRVKINDQGAAKVLEVIRQNNKKDGTMIIKVIERMRWPIKKGELLMFRYVKDEEVMAKSGVYRLNDNNKIRISILEEVNYKSLLESAKGARGKNHQIN